jgi:hypothetical protein
VRKRDLGFGLWVVGFVGFWVLRVLRVWRLCLVCILPVYFGAPYAFNKITYLSKKKSLLILLGLELLAFLDFLLV